MQPNEIYVVETKIVKNINIYDGPGKRAVRVRQLRSSKHIVKVINYKLISRK